MPGTPIYHTIVPGQSKRMNAFSFNRMMDAAEAHRDPRAVAEPSVIQPWQCTAWVYNISDRTFLQGECAKIVAPYYDPATSLSDLWSDMVLSVNVPNGQPYTCIAYEHIAPNTAGRAYVTGVCPAIVDVTDITHQYAKSKSDGSWELESGITGPYRIVWPTSPSVAKQTCIVAHLGTPGAGGDATVGIGAWTGGPQGISGSGATVNLVYATQAGTGFATDGTITPTANGFCSFIWSANAMVKPTGSQPNLGKIFGLPFEMWLDADPNGAWPVNMTSAKMTMLWTAPGELVVDPGDLVPQFAAQKLAIAGGGSTSVTADQPVVLKASSLGQTTEITDVQVSAVLEAV